MATDDIADAPRDAIPADMKPRVWGYDALRFIAMGCVAIRHLFHASDLDAGILSSHPGLAVFAGLSGYLALSSKGDSIGWLWKRLVRVYPSYWLCLAAIFTANALTSYKPVTADLIFCQFVGIAHFTHSGSLVGVHTWFITLIVSCYIMMAFIRLDRRLLLLSVPLVLALNYWQGDPMWGCALAFVGGALVAALPKVRTGSLCVAAVALAAATAFDPLFLNPFWGASALLLGSYFVGNPPRLVGAFSRCTYEFYLTHGPVYLGLAKVVGLSFFSNLLIGTPIAILSAFILQRSSDAAVAKLSSLLRRVNARKERPIEHGVDSLLVGLAPRSTCPTHSSAPLPTEAYIDNPSTLRTVLTSDDLEPN